MKCFKIEKPSEIELVSFSILSENFVVLFFKCAHLFH